jgi:hypothetical protein
MTKGLPDKSRVTTASRVRKSAMMGAAATALIAAAPSFSADAPDTQATTLRAAIRDVLHLPARQMAWREKLAATPETPARPSAIDIGNADDITVGPDESAVTHAESVEDVSLVNTGNLTGGIGIEVSTGDINLADAVYEESSTSSWMDDWEPLYDDAGNPIIGGYRFRRRLPSHLRESLCS